MKRLKKSLENISSCIRIVLEGKSKALNQSDISILEENAKIIENTIIGDKDYRELENLLNKTSVLYEEIKEKLKNFELFENKTRDFIEKIEELSLFMESYNQQEAKRLSQGAKLLKDFLEH